MTQQIQNWMIGRGISCVFVKKKTRLLLSCMSKCEMKWELSVTPLYFKTRDTWIPRHKSDHSTFLQLQFSGAVADVPMNTVCVMYTGACYGNNIWTGCCIGLHTALQNLQVLLDMNCCACTLAYMHIWECSLLSGSLIRAQFKLICATDYSTVYCTVQCLHPVGEFV